MDDDDAEVDGDVANEDGRRYYREENFQRVNKHTDVVDWVDETDDTRDYGADKTGGVDEEKSSSDQPAPFLRVRKPFPPRVPLRALRHDSYAPAADFEERTSMVR